MLHQAILFDYTKSRMLAPSRMRSVWCERLLRSPPTDREKHGTTDFLLFGVQDSEVISRVRGLAASDEGVQREAERRSGVGART